MSNAYYKEDIVTPYSQYSVNTKIGSRQQYINQYKGNLRRNQGYSYRVYNIDRQRGVNRTKRPDINHHYYSNDGNYMRGSGVREIFDSALAKAKSVKEKYDIFQQTLDSIKETGKQALNIYGSAPATYLKNALIAYDKNPNARSGYPGEKHIMLPSSYGWSMANYCGPGTNVDTRLDRGDPGVDGFNGIDSQCMKHDIRYRDARDINDIREADKDFLKDLNQSTGSTLGKRMIKGLMKGKMIAEDFGFLNPLEVTDLTHVSSHPHPREKKELKELEEIPEMKTQPVGDIIQAKEGQGLYKVAKKTYKKGKKYAKKASPKVEAYLKRFAKNLKSGDLKGLEQIEEGIQKVVKPIHKKIRYPAHKLRRKLANQYKKDKIKRIISKILV